MTQHYLNATQESGQDVLVFCGWDRMLQTYFLDVLIKHDDPKKEKDVIYCSMEDSQAPRRSNNWDFFSAKLSTMGINIPTDMRKALIVDAELDIGNESTSWN